MDQGVYEIEMGFYEIEAGFYEIEVGFYEMLRSEEQMLMLCRRRPKADAKPARRFATRPSPTPGAPAIGVCP